jgi:hypothetical protein
MDPLEPVSPGVRLRLSVLPGSHWGNGVAVLNRRFSLRDQHVQVEFRVRRQPSRLPDVREWPPRQTPSIVRHSTTGEGPELIVPNPV